jgi:hypothetical protein
VSGQLSILRELTRQRSRSGAIGLGAMVEIAIKDTLPASTRVAAARALMEFAGLIGSAKEMEDFRAAGAREKPPNYEVVLASIRAVMQPVSEPATVGQA